MSFLGLRVRVRVRIKTGQLRPFSKKKPGVGLESEQFDTFKLVPRDPG